jgi:hypothetical protein
MRREPPSFSFADRGEVGLSLALPLASGFWLLASAGPSSGRADRAPRALPLLSPAALWQNNAGSWACELGLHTSV